MINQGHALPPYVKDFFPRVIDCRKTLPLLEGVGIEVEVSFGFLTCLLCWLSLQHVEKPLHPLVLEHLDDDRGTIYTF